MRICMHSDRMSLIISLFDHIFIFRHGSCNKKRCFRIVFIQNVQHRLRILRRSVIQRQIDNFFIRLFCCTHFSSWLNCKFTSVICLIFLALIFFIGCISFILIDRKFFCSCFFLWYCLFTFRLGRCHRFTGILFYNMPADSHTYDHCCYADCCNQNLSLCTIFSSSIF